VPTEEKEAGLVPKGHHARGGGRKPQGSSWDLNFDRPACSQFNFNEVLEVKNSSYLFGPKVK
jgi:hypothetical protein